MITDDLAGVLNHATLVGGSIQASAGSAELSGTTLTWTIPRLAGDATVTYSVTVDGDAHGVTLTNVASVPADAPQPEPCASGDEDCRTTTHETPAAWTLTKSSDPGSGSTVEPGSTINYTLHVNRGSGDADPTGLVITDDLSGVLSHASFEEGSVDASLGSAELNGTTLTWTIPDLNANATLSYSVTVDDDAHGVSLTNVATAPEDAPQPQPCASGDEDCRTTTHQTPAAWTLTKSSDPDSGAVVQPGDTITYTLHADRGSGAVDPTDLVINDDLSGVLGNASFDSGSIHASLGEATRDGDTITWHIPALTEDATVTYSVTVDADAEGVQLVNVASVPSDAPQPEPCGETDPECRTTVHQTPNTWTLIKSSDPDSGAVVQPGDTITYTLTATPAEGGTAPTDVVVTDDLSGVLDSADLDRASISASTGEASLSGTTLTWDLGTLSQEETLTYTVTVHDDAWGVTLKNVASAPDGSPQPDPCPEANPDCRTTTHQTPAAWGLTKSSDPASGSRVVPGDTITYTLHADRGEGGADPTDLVITDDLSGVLDHAAFDPGSIDPSLGTASRSGTTLTWHIPALSKDATLTYSVTVDDDAWDVRLHNVASAPDGDPQPQPCAEDVPECRTTTHHTPPQDRSATWTVSKTSDPASGSVVRPGDVVTYTLTARLLSGTSAAEVRIVDDLSDVLDDASWVAGSLEASEGEVNRSGSHLTWRIAALSRTATLTYQVRVDPDTAGATLYNVVTAHGAEPCEPARAVTSGATSSAGRKPAARTLTCRETEQTVAATTPSPGGGGGTPGPSPTPSPTPGPTPSAGPSLPDTGGPSVWWAAGGILSVLAGALLVVTTRRRRSG